MHFSCLIDLIEHLHTKHIFPSIDIMTKTKLSINEDYLRYNNHSILATENKLSSIYFISQKVFFWMCMMQFQSDLMKL